MLTYIVILSLLVLIGYLIYQLLHARMVADGACFDARHAEMKLAQVELQRNEIQRQLKELRVVSRQYLHESRYIRSRVMGTDEIPANVRNLFNQPQPPGFTHEH